MTREILGNSPQVQALMKLIDKVAPSKTNVLVIGESGTGKELVARQLHERGPLKGKPFVAVNCGAIPENLIESELFGHKRGSFTGAVSDKPGLFEVADTGTIFLDEVGELPLAMQVKLLRTLQDRSFRRVGGNDLVKVDVRVIAATNRDLEGMVAQGKFREDLYYRLNVILIKTPPLRERTGDVQELARSFLTRIGDKHGKTFTGFSEEAMAALVAYSWPGNVRELENVIERAVTLSPDAEIGVSAFPPQLSGQVVIAGDIRVSAPDFSRGKVDLVSMLATVEREIITRALKHSSTGAAALLGLTPKSLDDRLIRLGIKK